MLRNLIAISLLLLCVAGCRGKKASADEQRAAEGSELEASAPSRPAPLLPDAQRPPEAIAEDGSGSGAAINSVAARPQFRLLPPGTLTTIDVDAPNTRAVDFRMTFDAEGR